MVNLKAKKIIKNIIISITFLLIVGLILLMFIKPNEHNVVSWYIGDANNDGQNEVLFILENNERNEEHELYGNQLVICDMKYLNRVRLNNIKNIEILFSVNLENLKPMKVMTGDINGDGLNEISLCVYKSTKFHPELAKRPFFYLLNGDELKPVWRGSCLSRPFDDYELFDLDEDGIDEIISIERLQDGKRVLAIYSWQNFGFIRDGESDAFKEKIKFKTTKKSGDKIKVSKNVFHNYFINYDDIQNKIFLNGKEG